MGELTMIRLVAKLNELALLLFIAYLGLKVGGVL
jgi:hypothetical protein